MLPAQIKIIDERLKNGTFSAPSYGTPHSAGLDLRAMPDGPLHLAPNEVSLVSSGVSVYIGRPGYVGLLFPRSGTGHKKGLVLGNLTGVIDADYQGPLMLSLWNRSGVPLVIEPGDLVAQLVVCPIVQLDLNVVESFSENTVRGEGGFGSTGSR
jgi:dUTP pyrophosphatase